MRVTERLEIKVKAALVVLPIPYVDRELLDYEIITQLQGPRDQVQQVYTVSLFLQLDAVDQVSLLSECDPYAPQEHVNDLVRALWDGLLDAKDAHIQAIAPGLVRARGQRLPSGLIIP